MVRKIRGMTIRRPVTPRTSWRRQDLTWRKLNSAPRMTRAKGVATSARSDKGLSITSGSFTPSARSTMPSSELRISGLEATDFAIFQKLSLPPR